MPERDSHITRIDDSTTEAWVLALAGDDTPEQQRAAEQLAERREEGEAFEAAFEAALVRLFSRESFPREDVARGLQRTVRRCVRASFSVAWGGSPLDEANVRRAIDLGRRARQAFLVVAVLAPRCESGVPLLLALLRERITDESGVTEGGLEDAALGVLKKLGGRAAPAVPIILQGELDFAESAATLAAIAMDDAASRDAVVEAAFEADHAGRRVALAALGAMGAGAARAGAALHLARLLAAFAALPGAADDADEADSSIDRALIAEALVAIAPSDPDVRRVLDLERARQLANLAPLVPRQRPPGCSLERTRELIARVESAATGHDRATAIEVLATASGDARVVVPMLVSALSDPDYAFCVYEGCVAPAWELLEPFAADAPGALPIACAELDGYPDNEAPLLPILRFLSAVPTPDAALIAAVQRLSDRLLRQDPLAEFETTQRALVLVRGWGG